MTKKDFASINDLLKHLNYEVKKTLQQRDTNVENVAKHEFTEAINDGYDMYDPLEYERQREYGGLSDPSNLEVINISEGIAIENIRKGVDGNGNVVDVLDVWDGHKPWGVPDKWGYGFEKDRHVIENANERLKGNKALKKAFELDLRNKGFKVK